MGEFHRDAADEAPFLARKLNDVRFRQGARDRDRLAHLGPAAQTPVDVLVTHDAAAFPDGYGPKGDPEFQALGARSMEMIASLVEQHRPLLHVHGHWHKRYERTDGVTRTIGLASNLQTTNAATEVWSKP